MRGCLCALLVLCTSGCALRRSVSGPAVPKAFITGKTLNYAHVCDPDQKKTVNDVVVCDVKNFQDCANHTAPKCDKAERDRIIYTLKLIIDRNYDRYAKNYEQVADTGTFAGEVSAASLSGVATVVGDAGMKAILALASTLTQSTLVSAQKNFYQKQAVYAILAVMDSQRLDKWKDILQTMKKDDVDEYSLSAALVDMADYQRRGTAVAGLESVQQSAGTTRDKAKTSIDNTKGINQP